MSNNMNNNNIDKFLRKNYKSTKTDSESKGLFEKILTTIPKRYGKADQKLSPQYRIATAAIFLIAFSISFWQFTLNINKSDRNDFTPTKVIYLTHAELDEDYFKPTKTIYLKESNSKLIKRGKNEKIRKQNSSISIGSNFIALISVLFSRNGNSIFS